MQTKLIAADNLKLKISSLVRYADQQTFIKNFPQKLLLWKETSLYPQIVITELGLQLKNVEKSVLSKGVKAEITEALDGIKKTANTKAFKVKFFGEVISRAFRGTIQTIANEFGSGINVLSVNNLKDENAVEALIEASGEMLDGLIAVLEKPHIVLHVAVCREGAKPAYGPFKIISLAEKYEIINLQPGFIHLNFVTKTEIAEP
ncbi:MAG: hypothetical protein PHV30_09690 [Candidatus Margulisbacteria bacterium]|nr:hypothetical protein [Candidatus Margulisiibacteriota bacterium]